MKKDVFVIVGVIALLVVLGVYFAFAPKAPELTYQPIDVGGGSITITDQNQVDLVVLDAELAAPGFITIHKTISDAPADIIGTSMYLETGKYTGIKIQLDELMTPGSRYAALLHADNGDQEYVTQEDLPVKTNDQVVRPYFIAIPEAGGVDLPTE